MKTKLFLPLFLLTACQMAPRMTTEEERAIAQQVLVSVETALIVLQATGDIEPERFALAMASMAELRKAVEESETNAIGWAEIMQRITNLAVQWLVPVPGVTS